MKSLILTYQLLIKADLYGGGERELPKTNENGFYAIMYKFIIASFRSQSKTSERKIRELTSDLNSAKDDLREDIDFCSAKIRWIQLDS